VRRTIAISSLLAALLFSVPAGARAASPDRFSAAANVLLPVYRVASPTVPPPGFSTNSEQAIAAAKTSPRMQALHRREHPLLIVPYVWEHAPLHWYVTFAYRGRVVAEVDLSPAARVEAVWTGPLAIATYARGHYAGLFDSWWIVVPSCLLFLLPFLDPRRLRRWLHVDALVLLSFMVSYALFNHAELEPSVWLAYPPLIYLLARMLWIGWRPGGNGGGAPTFLSMRVLTFGLIGLVVARVALSLISDQVIDVGMASAVGAHRIASGQSLYYATAGHSDTYGPVSYLAYLPFQWLFPWNGGSGFAAAAKAAAISFDIVTVIGLVFLGRRLRPRREGVRLGLLLGWAWAACPFTLLGLMVHTNDGLIAMLSVLSLLVFSSAPARGALLGLAAAAKFSPAALLPLYARKRGEGIRGVVLCAGSFTVVVVLAIGLYLPSGGISEFYNHTIGFQLTRTDVFSPWALHPGLNPIKTILEAGAILLALLVAFVPRERSLVQVCALAAAVTIAVQLPAVHWFYYYIIWFVPFVFVALLTPSGRARSLEPARAAEVPELAIEPRPSDRVLVEA
jgi:hypothetical protein